MPGDDGDEDDDLVGDDVDGGGDGDREGDFDHTCPHRCHLRLAKNFLRFSVLITWALFSIRIIEQKHKDIIRQREIVSYNHTFANKNHLGDKNGRMGRNSDKSDK